jgi:hypothetical protein
LEFDGQSLHVELAEAPTAVEYVPAPQSVHRDDPVNALYFPATHAVHVPPSGPVHPVLQVQLVKVTLPTDELEFDGQAIQIELTALEYVPAPQSVHTADPVEDLYFPATHAVHEPPSGPVHPALQVQLVKEFEFDRQTLHAELAEAPTALEYVPSEQSVHRDDPVNDLYFPATHAVHLPPFGPVHPALQVQPLAWKTPTGFSSPPVSAPL